ncbi:MAG: AAA family ATPase [Saprospiraceae bacterium]
MNAQHINYFKVSNFKKFDMLELDDIGQFNLIVGDNNVGKSSLLEALCLDTSPFIIENLLVFSKILELRGINIQPKRVLNEDGSISRIEDPNENFLGYLFKSIDKKTEFVVKSVNDLGDFEYKNTYKFTNDSRNWQDYLEKQNKNEPNFSLFGINYNQGLIEIASHLFFNGNSEESQIAFEKMLKGQPHQKTEVWGLYQHLNSGRKLPDLPFVGTKAVNTEEMPNYYFEQIGTSRNLKKQLIDNLSFILIGVEDFEVRKVEGKEHLMVGIRGEDELRPISMFGEGVLRASYLLLQILKNKGKRLMIDEVDTGIHHSRMKNFMKTLMQVAHAYEVQLFMTTHSLECQQAFVEALEIPEMASFQSKSRNISLFENPDKAVRAQIFSFESMKYALEIGFETRGN